MTEPQTAQMEMMGAARIYTGEQMGLFSDTKGLLRLAAQEVMDDFFTGVSRQDILEHGVKVEIRLMKPTEANKKEIEVVNAARRALGLTDDSVDQVPEKRFTEGGNEGNDA